MPLPTDCPNIPGYEIIELLSQGGMGVVYQARQPRLGRRVAIKLIRPDRLGNPEAVRRFQKEVQAAARLDHPHVVRVFEAGRLGKSYYLVMEYVDGFDLARVVGKQGPLPVGQAVECVRQAALALGHLAEQGLVHRDVKPANLLVAWRAGSPHVKLADLGLARPLELESGESGSTQLGAVIGTPDYIAPEQIEDPRNADIRADLYSLGCTFYFLLTGRPPFPGGTMIQKLDRQRWTAPPPLGPQRPDLPPEVEKAVHRLMAKSPSERYPTPDRLLDALDALRARLPCEPPACPPAPETAPPSDLDITVPKGQKPPP